MAALRAGVSSVSAESPLDARSVLTIGSAATVSSSEPGVGVITAVVEQPARNRLTPERTRKPRREGMENSVISATIAYQAKNHEDRDDHDRTEKQVVADIAQRIEAVMQDIVEMIAQAADDVVRRLAEKGEPETDDQADHDQLDDRPADRVAEKPVHTIRHS